MMKEFYIDAPGTSALTPQELIEMVRKHYPKMVAEELVSVQPIDPNIFSNLYKELEGKSLSFHRSGNPAFDDFPEVEPITDLDPERETTIGARFTMKRIDDAHHRDVHPIYKNGEVVGHFYGAEKTDAGYSYGAVDPDA